MSKGIVIQITGDGAGAAEALRMIEERMKETGEKGEEMSGQLAEAGERIKKAFEMVGVGIGIREVVDRFKEMIEQSVELAVEIGHLSQQTGISTENLSTLKYVSDQTGVSFESLTKGFKKLSTNLYEMQHGNKEAAATFKALGIDQKALEATGGDLYQVMGLVADRFKAMPDGFEKNALATKLFGKAGQELIPILNQGAGAIEQYKAKAESLGIVLDENGIQKMEELHHKLGDVKAAMEGVGLTITAKLAPAIEGLAGFMTNNFDAGLDAMNSWADQAVHQIARVGYAMAHPFSAGDFDKLYPGEDAGKGFLGAGGTGNLLAALRGVKGKEGGEGGGADFSGGEPSYADKSYLTFIDYRFKAIRDLIKERWQEIAQLNAEEGQKAWDALANQQPDLSVFGSNSPNVQYAPNRSNPQLEAALAAAQRRQEESDADGDTNKAQMAREAAGTIGGFMNQLTEQAIHGKVSFKSLVDSAISDLERFAMKVLEQRTLIPILNSLFGLSGGGGGAAAPSDYADVMSTDTGLQIPAMAGGGELSGGDMAIVGDSPSGDMSNAELFAPKGPGTILPHDVLEGIAKGGGGGGGMPSVQINNVNNSSQAVDMKQNGMSWDSDAKQFILHTVLEDAASGGTMAQMMSGFASR